MSYLCPTGPQGLASCACIQSGMSAMISSSLTDNVKELCDSTSNADLKSAIDVWDTYCSAASNKVKLVVSQSLAETVSGGSVSVGSSSPVNTGSPVGSGASGNGNSTGSESGGSTSSSGSSVNKTAVIAATVVGVVVGLALVGLVGWLIRRQHRKKKQREDGVQLASRDGPMTQDPDAKGEITGDKPTGPTNFTTPAKSELATHYVTSPKPRLSSPSLDSREGSTRRQELYGQQPTYEMSSPGAVHQLHGTTEAYEMDGGGR